MTSIVTSIVFMISTIYCFVQCVIKNPGILINKDIKFEDLLLIFDPT